MRTRTKQILLLTPLAVAAAYAVALTGFRAEPSGYVASYSFLPHARTDVLDFSHGIVTLRTCCGDSPCGTYSLSPEGRWVWHLRYGSPKPHLTGEIHVRSSAFSMSFSDLSNPSSQFTLRRRVFTTIPL